MSKVTVTIKNGSKSRTYSSDYAFVSLLNEEDEGGRWEQEPVGWKDGMGIFFSGMYALKAVAEQSGDEVYKEAARAAMDVLGLFDPFLTKEDKDVRVGKIQDIISGFEIKTRKKRKSTDNNIKMDTSDTDLDVDNIEEITDVEE